MPKKLTIEFIKEQFEREGYKLLTKDYVNSKQNLNYICLKGHNHSIQWFSWKQGCRCPYCVGVVKKDIEFVRSEFKKEGYRLLTKEYTNSFQRLNYLCPEGHEYFIQWVNWQQGKRCFYCNGNIKLTMSFVRSEFEKESYKLLTVEYKNAHQGLNYICPEEHKHSIQWSAWRQGVRCPTCSRIKQSGETHYNWKGGISCEPYCDAWADKEYKNDIKERDNYDCQNPDCWRTSKKLCLHHIDYVKKHCDPWNLITLCNSCNARANFNRDWYTEFYKKIINRSISCG